MTPQFLRKTTTRCAVLLSLLASGYACSADTTSGTGGSAGSNCDKTTDCVSGVCTAGQCVGNGEGAPAGSTCVNNSICASNSCVNGLCVPGSSLEAGKSCSQSSECANGLCKSGVCTDKSATASGGSGNGGGMSNQGGGLGVITSANPPYAGLGEGWRPLTPGCGPNTAKLCTGGCEAAPDNTATVIRPPALLCFSATADSLTDPTPETPAAIIEQVIETVNGQSYVHIRVTFDPAFADNTYGANASAGWFATNDGKTGKGHTFTNDLTGSDHLDLMLTDTTGATVMAFGEDYITSLTDAGKPGPGKKPGETATGGTTGTTSTTSNGTTTTGCGFSSLGVLGGDGEMITGDSSDILAVATSIERNIGGCGYCSSTACSAGATGTGDGDCSVNSPITDENYKVNDLTPNWNYSVVYEVWIDLSAFGTAGFGQAFITYVHASPSKLAENTLYVEPSPCPPNWGTCGAGENCAFPPSTGTGGAGGSGGTGNTGSGCEPNQQLYITQESVATCTPIPFAGYPNMAACPSGYQLDTASEGQYCLPVN